MKLDLTRYRQPLTHVVKTFKPAEAGGEGEAYRVVEPVELEFDLHKDKDRFRICLLYTSPSPRDGLLSRMPSSA